MFSYTNTNTNTDTNLSHSQHDSRQRLSSPKKKRRKYSNETSASTSGHSLSSSVGRTQTSNLNISIIDRVIDLNKYDKHTALYTLCRDWINATTSIAVDSTQPTEEIIDLGTHDTDTITALPDPVQDEITETMSIASLNERIRTEIRASEKSDLELIKTLKVNNDDAIQTHALLKLHMNRWKSVRKEWVGFYAEKNRPYKNSLDILNTIFETN